MKTMLLLLLWIFLLSAFAAEPPAPRIFAFGHNGTLLVGNLAPGTVATVEWASSLDGPWTNDWAGLQNVVANSLGIIRVKVPMFYRVRVGPPFPDPADFSWIPPGTFMMGSPDTEVDRLPNEGPQTQVTISQGFWMGRYEVTQQEYLEVTGSNPAWFNGLRISTVREECFPIADYGTNLLRPVENVDRADAANYCALLTEQKQSAGQLPAGYVYRLPTEAEWEYACRAGTTTRFSYGDDLGYWELPNHEWTGVNSSGQSHQVGQKTPNAWGLYDMHGNVMEMCQDRLGAYPGGSVTDPTGPASGSSYVCRGGFWGLPQAQGRYCRSAQRGWTPWTDRCGSMGFRVVLARPLS